MALQAGRGFAFQFNHGRFLKRAFNGLLITGFCLGLQACASQDPSWPVIGKVSDLTNILSPEERQKAVADLQKQDQGGAVKPVSNPTH